MVRKTQNIQNDNQNYWKILTKFAENQEQNRQQQTKEKMVERKESEKQETDLKQ